MSLQGKAPPSCKNAAGSKRKPCRSENGCTFEGGQLNINPEEPETLPYLSTTTVQLYLTTYSENATPSGPFRIEFVLGSEFVIHESEMPLSSFEEGYSYLKMHPEFERLEAHLTYSDTTDPSVLKEAGLRLKGAGHMLRRIVVETPEIDMRKAIRHTGQIVADLLDALSLLKRVPLSIRHIEVHAVGKKFLRSYMTLPYGPRQLNPDDLMKATTVPRPLRPAVRLFREGLSSSRPPYRLLCLYRVREVIDEVRRKNDQEVLSRGITPYRQSRLLPDTELTRCYFPAYIGKKVGAFLDHVRSNYRLAVAHANIDAYFKLTLDPADVRIDHKIDFTNAALMPVVAEMIEDEITLMTQLKLGRIVAEKG
jgi:hypothetical protein